MFTPRSRRIHLQPLQTPKSARRETAQKASSGRCTQTLGPSSPPFSKSVRLPRSPAPRSVSSPSFVTTSPALCSSNAVAQSQSRVVASAPPDVLHPLAKTSLLHVLGLALHRCITGRHPGTAVKHKALQTRSQSLAEILSLPSFLALSLSVFLCVFVSLSYFVSLQTRQPNPPSIIEPFSASSVSSEMLHRARSAHARPLPKVWDFMRRLPHAAFSSARGFSRDSSCHRTARALRHQPV